MRGAILIVVHDEREGEGDNLFMVFDDDLAFGELSNQFDERFLAPAAVDAGVNTLGELADGWSVVGGDALDGEVVDLVFCVLR
ncbi:MAG: hypothetical protein ACJAQT_005088 [Akkermansiaceae bacterium]|jgi:hypothetical protein